MRPALLQPMLRSIRSYVPVYASQEAGSSSRHAFTSSPLRTLTSSPHRLKKSKAAAVRKQHQELKNVVEEELDVNPEGGRDEQAPLNDVDSVSKKTQEKMKKAADWAKIIVYEGVERVRGSVSPALLDGIKVTIPDMDGSHPLAAFASITTRQGALWVDVWDQDHMKYVESAINAANLPGISPLRFNETSLKIPIARPTFEQRQDILKRLASTIETAKRQVRKARSEGINSLGGKYEPGTDQVEKLANDFGGQLDQVLSQAKKEFEKV